LRHTFASRLRMHGVELATIRDLLGHTTTRMTERYAHVAPSHPARRSADPLEAANERGKYPSG
jgi:site-specific recombinase XerD